MGKGNGKGEGQGQGAGGKGWEHGIFGCLSNPCNCLCGLFCTPCQVCMSGAAMGKSCLLYSVLTFLCPCLAVAMVRQDARVAYDVSGNTCDDVCCAILCPACVSCQVANEIDHHRNAI